MLEFTLNLLTTALANAQADWRNANQGWTNPAPGEDYDDQRWAYEAQVRAEWRLRWLGIRNFDVA